MQPMALIRRLRIAKKKAPPMEVSWATPSFISCSDLGSELIVIGLMLQRPKGIKTHLRNMVIMPEMIGSVVGIYNGKVC